MLKILLKCYYKYLIIYNNMKIVVVEIWRNRINSKKLKNDYKCMQYGDLRYFDKKVSFLML